MTETVDKTNTLNQALSNFGEAYELHNAMHSMRFRSDKDPQLKALLPIILPKLEEERKRLIELAITQWEIYKKAM